MLPDDDKYAVIESDHYQEVSRREQEIAEKKAALEDMKRKNQMVQDKVQEQIKTLTMKLDELRVEHQTNEASSDSIISCLQDKLIQVRSRAKDCQYFSCSPINQMTSFCSANFLLSPFCGPNPSEKFN